MLDTLFITILNLSYTASFVIVFVLIARVLMKKLPKIFLYLLWIPVIFKLVCPFSFENILGLLPSKTSPISEKIIFETVPQINTGFDFVDNSINAILPASPQIGNSINPIQIWLFFGEIVWVLGIVALLVYSVISLIKLNSKLKVSVCLRDNIYIADHINSPFVKGFIKPKIYLPSNLSEHEQAYIIEHEQTHIKRFDHITRLVSFAVLCVHWFNPLVWIAFVLSTKDMEMSCDEAVMNKTNVNIKKDYSSSLLRFAVGRNVIHPTPLAFGESDTKSRVKNIMKYKKPVKTTAIILVVLIAIFCVFLISKQSSKEEIVKSPYDTLEIFKLENVQSGTKSVKLITDQERILEYSNYFESGNVTSDAKIEKSTKPYYYRFYKDDEIVLEYIFQDDNFNLMYQDGVLKNVEYPENEID